MRHIKTEQLTQRTYSDEFAFTHNITSEFEVMSSRSGLFLLQLFLILGSHSISVARGLSTCPKLIDIDLQNENKYMNYAVIQNGLLYGVEKAFDRNTSTFVQTSFSNTDFNSPYLDNGYNWVMVELDEDKFQMVDSITLLLRRDISSPLAKRLQDIEVLISNQIDYTPTMYTSSAAGRISWNNFVYCGTTGSTTGDVTVDCSQNVINSKYVAVRRNKETGATATDYCCFTFSEFQVNLGVQLDQPKTSNVPSKKNQIVQITSKLFINCVLPSFLNLKWRKNGANSLELGNSTTLTISNATEDQFGTYYYEVFNARNMDLIFKSESMEVVFIQRLWTVSDSRQMCSTACVSLLSSAVVVLAIALIGGAVWEIKYIRQNKFTKQTFFFGKLIRIRNVFDNPGCVVRRAHRNVCVQYNSDAREEMTESSPNDNVNETIEIAENRYEKQDDVVYLNETYESDEELGIIKTDKCKLTHA